MKIVYTRSSLSDLLTDVKRSDIGFVPTMGALHRGHIALVNKARSENSVVIVSIFVNPTQFNDKDDLKRYPRTPDSDLKLLEQAGADIVFMPGVEEMYPEPDTRKFDFGDLDKVMEGATRPGHFNGVAQVVSKLFDCVKPGKAYFGQKDFQQVAVIREMVRQLGYDIEIVTVPIVRDDDGLALSSRNALLGSEERKAAPRIHEALEQAKKNAETMTPAEVKKIVAKTIDSDPRLEVIYFEIVNGRTLQQAKDWEEGESGDGIQGCIAVQAGGVRLIDNITLV